MTSGKERESKTQLHNNWERSGVRLGGGRLRLCGGVKMLGGGMLYLVGGLTD